jgi:hypothetical protein
MQPLFNVAHALTRTIALLVLAVTFVMMLFGWALHGLIAALIFSSFFVLAGELRAAALSRQPARARRPVRRPR